MRHRPAVLSAFVLVLGLALPAQATADAATKPDAKPAAPVAKMVALRGNYADLAEGGFDLPTALLGGGGAQAKSFYALVEQLDELAKDPETKHVLVDLSQPVGVNLVQVAELERGFARLRQAGKKCYAYLENATRAQYHLAAQCDQILMADMGVLDIGSLSMSTMFMKDAFDLLGIQTDVIRCGDFKGAAEPYMNSQMSPHLRRHYTELLESINAAVVRGIAKGRGIAPDKVRTLQGERIFPAERAMVAGLVDRLVPWQGAKRALSSLLANDQLEVVDALKSNKKKRSFNPMQILQDLLNPKEDDDDHDENQPIITVLHLSGPISDGIHQAPGNIVSGPAVELIQKIAANDKVKGVVVRINSPGGSATASEAILLALRDLAAKKPVVCSMGYVAGSGGYYITCFGRPILAESGTITGSIGVFGMKTNLGPLMRRIGVREETIALDESATLDSMGRAWTDEEKARIQTMIDGVYDRFLNHVATSRKLPRAEVEAMAGGRVYSGEQALARKLVDKVGGLDDAVAMVAQEAKLEGWRLEHSPRPRNFMQTLTEQMFDAQLLASDPASRAVLGQLAGWRSTAAVVLDALTNRGVPRVWAMMPVELQVR